MTTLPAKDIENIKLIELIHLLANFASGGFLGVIGIALFLLFNKEITPEVRAICYDIINFNLSFIIYFVIGFVLIFALIGIVILPIVYCLWIVLLVIGAIKHFAGERYTYPMTITFLK